MLIFLYYFHNIAVKGEFAVFGVVFEPFQKMQHEFDQFDPETLERQIPFSVPMCRVKVVKAHDSNLLQGLAVDSFGKKMVGDKGLEPLTFTV